MSAKSPNGSASIQHQGPPDITLRDLFTDPNHPLWISPYFWILPILFYPLMCALLRNFRVRSTLETYPYTTRRSMSTMTQSDAFHIQQNLYELEFVFTFYKAIQFALFRTYGIPSISKLLSQTGQLSSTKTSTKRYVDTEVLIADFIGYHPKSERAAEAIGRINYLHSHYVRSGLISNDDLLYTLSLFALEPIRWINRWEWRQLEEFERCALGTFWKGIGDAMEISYSPLKSGGSGGFGPEGEKEVGWIDGLQWLSEIEDWATSYEETHMVPHIDNFNTAEQTIAILLWKFPKWARPIGKRFVYVLMDDRLRTAMMYPTPPAIYTHLTHLILTTRKLLLRHLTLPRPPFLRSHMTTTTPSPSTGRFHMTFYEAAPWYVRPTFWRKYGFRACYNRLMGLPVPGDDGDKWRPDGYHLVEIGPERTIGKGRAFLEGDKERVLRVRGARGCPFGRAKVE